MVLRLCYSHLFDKGIDFCLYQWFCQTVWDYLNNKDITQLNSYFSNLTSGIMVLDVNMLGHGIEHRVVDQRNRFLFVTLARYFLPPSFIYLRLLLMTCKHLFPIVILLWAYCLSGYKSQSSVSKSVSEVASLTTRVKIAYLVLIEKNEIVGCFFEQ